MKKTVFFEDQLFETNNFVHFGHQTEMETSFFTFFTIVISFGGAVAFFPPNTLLEATNNLLFVVL